MSVGDSGHGVDLEVLVRTDLGDSLDRAPVSETGLGIVEPLVAQVLHVVVVEVSNALSDLTARNAAANGEDLVTDLCGNFSWSLTCDKFVVKLVTATEDLDVVEEVGVDGRKADTAVVHLSGEDLVTEEVVSEDTAIRVGVIEGLSDGNIGEISKKCVH